MGQLAAALQWLRSHLLQSLLALVVAFSLVYYQLAQNRAQAQVSDAQQRLKVVQVQAARVEAREKKSQFSQQVVDNLQGGLLTGDVFYGRLSTIQRAERESGVHLTAFAPGPPEAIGAAPAIQPPVNTSKPASEAEQLASAGAPKPAPAPAPTAPSATPTVTYKRYPVQIAVEGPYSQIIAFMRNLERGAPVARINPLELSVGAGNSVLTATVYFYGP